jgi:DNA (cytosine-5)-methyltransferase 1
VTRIKNNRTHSGDRHIAGGNGRLVLDLAKAESGSSTSPSFVDINLFAGAGGLALGLMQAGFTPTHFFEQDSAGCETLRNNIRSQNPSLRGVVHEGDVARVDWTNLKGMVRLLAGGVPCQPFSVSGKHKAEKDRRNLFPEALRAIRETQPAVVLIENVRGLLRETFRPYFEYILRQLESPSIAPGRAESWRAHDGRIRSRQCGFGYWPEYLVSWRLLDSADYGVPQNRHRVFIVATRVDVKPYAFPKPTHSKEALFHAQKERHYWKRHGLDRSRPAFRVRKSSSNGTDGLLPWVTVRDGLLNLPAPASKETADCNNHWKIPGARSYKGHRGSKLDLPSKTLKAGVHGVPGGENTMRPDAGRVRYFTLRECARLQSFPDNHEFMGTRKQVTRQVGNAVPCGLAAAVAKPLHALVASFKGSPRNE